MALAKRHLDLLDKISFFRRKTVVDQDFVQYFHSDFDAGRMFLIWLTLVGRIAASEDSYRHFRKIKDTIDYGSRNVMLPRAFYYYANRHDRDPSYDPFGDGSDPSLYDLTSHDTSMIKP